MALALSVAFGLAAGAPPASAGDRTKPLSTSAAAHAARANLAHAVAQDAPTAGTSNGSFFRSPKGVAVLVLLAAGFGYTVYSRSEDRVKSQVR
jgi:hypothetical protein